MKSVIYKERTLGKNYHILKQPSSYCSSIEKFILHCFGDVLYIKHYCDLSNNLSIFAQSDDFIFTLIFWSHSFVQVPQSSSC